MGPVGAALLAVVLVGSMIVLVVVLSRASGSGRKAIEAYVASIKAGANVSEAIAGREVDAVTRALRESESFSISNFQSQQDTSCFWLKLRGKQGDVEARAVLVDRSSTTEVSALSLGRECECPVDHDLPCRLR